MEIDMSARGVEKQIRKLREAGIIKRIGADRGGYWEIIERWHYAYITIHVNYYASYEATFTICYAMHDCWLYGQSG